MWLLLTEPLDTSADWLVVALAQRTGERVLHLTSEDLHTATITAHDTTDHDGWLRLRTLDGRSFDSRAVRGVINRLQALPPGLASRLQLTHQDRMVRTFASPVLRWLNECEGPVLNRPTANGLSGDYRTREDWMAMADRIGFMSAPETAAPAAGMDAPCTRPGPR